MPWVSEVTGVAPREELEEMAAAVPHESGMWYNPAQLPACGGAIHPRDSGQRGPQA